MPALPGSHLCSQTSSFPPSAFPVIAKAPGNLQSPLDWSGSRWYCVQWLLNPRAALRHSSGAASLSIYFPSFRSQGAGLLLSSWLLWGAMCCKYNILLSSDGTVTQFRVWRGGQDPKGGFPVLCESSGPGVCHTEICPTPELPQQLPMLCSMHLYRSKFTYA